MVMINDVLATHGMPETPWAGVKASGVGQTHGDESLCYMCQ
jgi:succinate-semialdehyde dehydrogenase/glutarate-semialdehyde dehydrogenase